MSASETLCCCEYENMNGERSHLLAFCCDCEALDQIADRCFKCEKLPTTLVDRFIDTVIDRCRIPGLKGGGASRISLEVATPILLIPASLMIAAKGPMTTCVVLSLLPYFCFFFYRTWKRKTNKSRTKFFFAWGLSSVVYMYLLFELVVCRYTNVSKWDNLMLSAAMVGMCVSLMYAKQDPGQLVSDRTMKHLDDCVGFDGEAGVNKFGGDSVQDRYDDVDEGFEMIERAELEMVTVEKDGEKDDRDYWCNVCNIAKPPRSGHCTVCGVCVKQRDHHCVWIDSCIGENNHRSFLVAMAMFVFAGYYGSYLTLCSVCDPAWPHEIDCAFHVAYRDFKWGVSYAGAWYTILVTTIMFIGLVHQILLISQNLTSQELHKAVKLSKTRCVLYSPSNPYNRGLFQNWSDFIMKERTRKDLYETV